MHRVPLHKLNLILVKRQFTLAKLLYNNRFWLEGIFMGLSGILFKLGERFIPRAATTVEKTLCDVSHSVPIAAEIPGLKMSESLTEDVFMRNPLVQASQHPLALPAPSKPLQLCPPSTFIQLSEAENALLPEALKNTKMGQTFAQKIPEIRGRETEKAYVIDEYGEIIAETQSNNAFMHLFTDNDIANILPRANNGVKLGMLHNHPAESSLSSGDIIQFLTNKYTSVMATTPSGGHAFLHRTRPLAGDAVKLSSLESDRDILLQIEIQYGIKLLRAGRTNREVLEETMRFNDEQLKRFVQKHNSFGFQYEYVKGPKPSKSISNSDLDALFEPYKDLRGNYQRNGYSDDQIDAFFKSLDETPVEQFYVDYIPKT